MEVILPSLSTLHDYAVSITTKPSHPQLTIACVQILEASSFFFPEQRSSVWNRLWDCMLSACREKTVQPAVAVRCFKSLSLLCPLMLESFPQCGPDIRELLASTAISSELESGGVVKKRFNKRRIEHSCTSKYGEGVRRA